MNTVFPLNTLREGQSGCVTDIRSVGTMRRRLQDIGLIEGTRVECLQRSPCGDPIAFWIRGAAIALRNEDSGDILVRMNA